MDRPEHTSNLEFGPLVGLKIKISNTALMAMLLATSEATTMTA